MGAGRHTTDRVLTEICNKMFPVTDIWLGRSRKRTEGTDTEMTTEYSALSRSAGQFSLGRWWGGRPHHTPGISGTDAIL